MESPKLKNVSLEVRNAFYVGRGEGTYEILLGGDGLEERREDLENPRLGMLGDDKEEGEGRRVGLVR